MDANDSDCLVGVNVVGAALGEATVTQIKRTNRGIAKTLLPGHPADYTGPFCRIAKTSSLALSSDLGFDNDRRACNARFEDSAHDRITRRRKLPQL